jgi:hypothetical protein
MVRVRHLIPRTRVCCVCGDSVAVKARPGEGRPEVVAITPVIYRLGKGKKQLKNAASVRVCRPCLIKSVTAGRLQWSIKGNVLWDAIRAAISDCYTYLVNDDEMENGK